MKFCVSTVFIALGFTLPLPAGEKTKVPTLNVVNSRGKEVELKQWKLVEGGLTLTFLKSPLDCIVFRETDSTIYKDGIATLVPLTAIRRIDYDIPKQTVRLAAALPNGKDRVLAGTTRYLGINKIVIQGDVDLGDLGTASFKYHAGQGKGLQSIQFGEATPLPEPTGKKAVIVGNDKSEPKEHVIFNPTPLYSVNGVLTEIPQLGFRKTVKVKLEQIQRLRLVPSPNKKVVSLEYDVTLSDDKEFTLTLLPEPNWEKKNLSLVGIIGRVDVGYQLFPMHTIREYRWHTK